MELCEIASELLEDLPRMPVQAHPALISAINSLFHEWVDGNGSDRELTHSSSNNNNNNNATGGNSKNKKQAALDYNTQQQQYNASSAQGQGLPYQPLPLTGTPYEGGPQRGNNNNKGMGNKGDKRNNQPPQSSPIDIQISPVPMVKGGKGARGNVNNKGGRDSSSVGMGGQGGPYGGGMRSTSYQGQGLAPGR